MRLRRRPEVIAGRVAADGSFTTGSGFVSAKTATGSYLITCDPGFRVVSVVVTSNNNPMFGVTGQFSGNSFAVFIYNSSSVLTDQQFSFIAVGSQV